MTNMKKLTCNESGKYTHININVEPWELCDAIDIAANKLLRREQEHVDDYVCINTEKMESEIYHAAGDLCEHLGEYRSFNLEK